MPLYECVLIARSDVTPQQVEGLADQMAAVIGEGGGSVGKKEYWGLRNLAYRIKKNRKGHYLLMNIDAPPAAVTEMERQLRLNEDILRFLTVRVEALEEGPSAIVARGGRDERGERGDRGGRFGDRGPRPPRGDRPERGDRPARDTIGE
ncbi:30S ribosomal protein S6 [Elioraea tepidiphila]|jgi:small subunit ribosomal protein S6|uniref:30S ribosomal protein S6 n=2 Tax=Elioraea tepidiphila TaxID=457934 RepID=UPI00036AFDCA|nr:30S ribosomal protein S6 [Elioraea tepidiphila]